MHLTGKQRRFLRAHGHKLKPLVRIGKQGLAPTVLAQVEACLVSHELVKLKLLEGCPLTVGECAEALAEASHAGIAQTLGRTILLYRPHPETPTLKLPAGPPEAADGVGSGAADSGSEASES
jgi:RNA-binding protein